MEPEIRKKGDDMKRFTIVFFFLLSIQTFSESLTFSAGLKVEPYIIETQDAGFEVDIVREAFALEGYNVQFDYQPLLRTKYSFKIGHVDGVMTIKKHYPEVQGAFFSEQYITYHNFAISLRSNNYKINTASDLAGVAVAGFQQAKFALGQEFELMAKNNSSYREMAHQNGQISMLFSKHTDIIILDHLIFNYYRNRLTNHSSRQPVTLHDLFEPSVYRMAFKDDKIRDTFNMGLKKLKSLGHYNKIINRYIKNK
ncbi:MAG: transporter substrate-binding domain-containing protein [Bermanella sp.]